MPQGPGSQQGSLCFPESKRALLGLLGRRSFWSLDQLTPILAGPGGDGPSTYDCKSVSVAAPASCAGLQALPLSKQWNGEAWEGDVKARALPKAPTQGAGAFAQILMPSAKRGGVMREEIASTRTVGADRE